MFLYYTSFVYILLPMYMYAMIFIVLFFVLVEWKEKVNYPVEFAINDINCGKKAYKEVLNKHKLTNR